MSLIPYCDDNRLALARKSNIDNEGVSSINKGAFSNELTLTFNCFHSWSARLPVRSFSEERPVSQEIRRVINWTDDISREKKATGIEWSTQTFRAIDKVNAVFPIPGRAATIIKSLDCQPEVSLSKSVNPDGTPLRPALFEISSIFFFALWQTLR